MCSFSGARIFVMAVPTANNDLEGRLQEGIMSTDET